MITYTLLICSWAFGIYWQGTGNIEICSSLPVAEQKIVIAHELGHKFWFEKMTEADRQEWADYRNSLGYNYLFWHTTPSVEEDFAYTIQDLYKRKCTHQEVCDFTKQILKRYK